MKTTVLFKRVWARMLLFFLAILASPAITFASSQNDYDGEWHGRNKEGDVSVILEFSKDSKSIYCDYDSQNHNGVVTLYYLEPNGHELFLEVFVLDSRLEDRSDLSLDYQAIAIDKKLKGSCKIDLEGDKLVIDATPMNSDQPIFDKVLLSRVGEATTTTAAVDEVPAAQDTKWTKNRILNLLIPILVYTLYISMLVHMAYMLYRGDRYKVQFTVDYMTAQRRDNNQPVRMSEREFIQVYELLERAYKAWSVISLPGEEEQRRPVKNKELKASIACLDWAIALHPNDENLVNRLNDLTRTININEKRYFNGSKPLIVAMGILCILPVFFSAWSTFFTFILVLAMYILSTYTPAFLLEKRTTGFFSNINSRIFAGAFGLIGSAHTVRTVYKYSDGTKETEDDYTEHVVSWILALLIIGIMVGLIVFFALINYIRNYVLYT